MVSSFRQYINEVGIVSSVLCQQYPWPYNTGAEEYEVVVKTYDAILGVLNQLPKGISAVSTSLSDETLVRIAKVSVLSSSCNHDH